MSYAYKCDNCGKFMDSRPFVEFKGVKLDVKIGDIHLFSVDKPVKADLCLDCIKGMIKE